MSSIGDGGMDEDISYVHDEEGYYLKWNKHSERCKENDENTRYELQVTRSESVRKY